MMLRSDLSEELINHLKLIVMKKFIKTTAIYVIGQIAFIMLVGLICKLIAG